MEMRYEKDGGYSFTLGMSLTIELLKHQRDKIVKIILHTKIIKNNFFDIMMDIIDENNIFFEYDDKLIEKISVKENCYVIGVFKKYFNDLTNDNHIVLNEINDEGELGTIIRSLASFNYKNLVLINPKVDLFNPKVVRASMGGLFLVNLKIYNNFEEYIHDFPRHKILNVNQKSDKKLFLDKKENKFSLLFDESKKGFYFYKPQNFKLSMLCSCILYELNSKS